ncbi:MAG: DUF885 domain-containing protein [Eubacterium sp.]|nr:DUF885 domain-containing protein [Eubacterium sp.]
MNRRKTLFPKRVRYWVSLLLIAAISLSLCGCGKEQTMTGEKTGSIFNLFATEDDPFAEANTGGGSGDRTEELPSIQPSTEDTQAPTTEDTTEETTYAAVENEELNNLFLEFFRERVTKSTLSYKDHLRNGDSLGIPAPEVGWGAAASAKETVEKEKERTTYWISTFEAIDRKTLTEQQAFDLEYLLDELKISRAELEYYRLKHSFSPSRGLQEEIPLVFTTYDFYSKEAVEDYITLVNQLPDYIRAELEGEEKKVEEGYGLEDGILDVMIGQCDEILKEDTDDSFMVAYFNECMDGITFLTETEREEFKKRNREAVEKAFLPAYEDMKKTFQSWKGKGKVQGGLCSYGQEGNEYYALLLKKNTGSDKTPQEMIDYMQRRENELHQEMYEVYYSDPDGYEYYIDNAKTLFDYQKEIPLKELMDQIMEKSMGDFPKTDSIPYSIANMSKTLEKVSIATGAFYMFPPIDNPDGNLIRVNAGSVTEPYETLAHEGYPGHMYQNMYFARTNPSLVRRLFLELGYMEGWAVYTAYQAVSNCDFNGNKYAKTISRLANINREYIVLIQSFIDLKINYEGWTVKDIENYLKENDLTDKSEGAQEFYNMLVGDASSYLSYSMGYYEMADLRTYAENALGSKFDPVEYHKVILETGPCYYHQLKQRVDKYIKEHT